jgi:hypothetical protein
MLDGLAASKEAAMKQQGSQQGSSKEAARKQQGSSKGAARKQQGSSKEASKEAARKCSSKLPIHTFMAPCIDESLRCSHS